MQRTYSKIGTRRIARLATESSERSPERSQLRKKRKIQVEVVAESASSSAAERAERPIVDSGSGGRRGRFISFYAIARTYSAA